MKTTTCYCGADKSFESCCELYIKGIEKAKTAEALMRSRFSAYATKNIDYLLESTHLSERKYYTKEALLEWATSNKWLRLEIIETNKNTVTFKAYFLDDKLVPQVHHEKSTFKFERETWFYVDGVFY